MKLDGRQLEVESIEDRLTQACAFPDPTSMETYTMASTMASRPERECVSNVVPERTFSLDNTPKPLSARDFCRKIFAIDEMPAHYIKLYENQIGYRQKCIKLLGDTLGLTPNTIKNWGYEFQKMPPTHRRTLGMAYERWRALHELEELKRCRQEQ
jgi:hypothetical protein